MNTRVFISWSGEQSKAIAEIMKDWLIFMFDAVSPYYTPSDIEKGVSWIQDLEGVLGDCSIGIFCLTPECRGSDWMHYEAGAISAKVGKRVCPVLFGVTNTEVIEPFATLQLTVFNQNDLASLFATINNSLEESKLSDDKLRQRFNDLWTRYSEKIGKVLNSPPSEASKKVNKQRTERDIQDEILKNTRHIVQSLERSGRIFQGRELRSSALVARALHQVSHTIRDYTDELRIASLSGDELPEAMQRRIEQILNGASSAFFDITRHECVASLMQNVTNDSGEDVLRTNFYSQNVNPERLRNPSKPLPASGGVIGRAFITEDAVCWSMGDKNFTPIREDYTTFYRSGIVIPFRVSLEFVGVLNIDCTVCDGFSHRDHKHLGCAFADAIGALIGATALYKELKASKDPSSN